jgi:hypothetical protein
MGLTILAPSLIHIAFPPSFEGVVFVVSNDEPLVTGRLIKRGPIGRKEMPTTGLGEWFWRMPKRMR